MTKIDHLPIPAAALTKHIGFLGINGSGKTSVCKSAVVEPALEAGERVLAIDPTGVWWGLRLSATGKRKGYPIYIFGGEHGDYPLRKNNAAELAEAFGTSSDSAIFDTSQMTVTERTLFFTEFAETLLRKNKGPVKLIIDEAHLFMPQSGARGGGLAPDMLHAGNNLVSLGRSKGLRISLISQRPAKLHKDSLTQVHSLVAMRLIAPQDRAAVKEWIGDQADPTEGERIIASLPSLAPGEAWVWAPAEKYLERVKFARPATFDSSAAPDESDPAGPELAPINLDALKGKLAAIDAEKKANDPVLLRAEIAKLKQGHGKADSDVIADLATEYQRGCGEGMLIGEQQTRDKLLPIISRHIEPGKQLAASLVTHLENVISEITGMQTVKPAPISKPKPALPRNFVEARTPADNGIPEGERKIMIALAQYGEISRNHLTAVTGYARSTRNTYLSRLQTKQFISSQGDNVSLTREGLSALGPYEPLPTGRDLQDYHLQRLPEGEAKILRALIPAHPHGLTRDRITDQTGYARSTRNTYLSRLTTRRLVQHDGEIAKAAAELFG